MADSEIQKFLLRNNVTLSSEDQKLLKKVLSREKEDPAIEANRDKPGDFDFKINQLKPNYDDGSVSIQAIVQNELLQQKANLQNMEYDDGAILLQKQMQLQQTQRKLDEKRRTFALDQEQIQKQKELLDEQLQSLKIQQNRFQQFLKEGEAKRIMYVQQTRNNYETEHNLREQEVQQKQLMQALKLLARSQQRKNDGYKCYFDFTATAGQLDADFKQPENVTKRFDNLRSTGSQLQTKLNVLKDELGDLKNQQMYNAIQSEAETVDLRNHLRKLETALSIKQQKQGPGESSAAQADKSRTEYGSVLLGVNNLFRRVIDLSKRDVIFEGMNNDNHEVLVKKINIIAEVIADLRRLKDYKE